jgi:outer membrane protein assembly factor BamB
MITLRKQLVCVFVFTGLGLALRGCAAASYSSPSTNPATPAISAQPANQAATVGQSATFSVTATGTAPLAYQWQKNNASINGAISASYTTPATVSRDSGATFRVTVTNSAGSVTSNSATLTVNPMGTRTGTDVTTYHNDVARTGQNLTETVLTQANVNSTTFGLLHNLVVDGRVDAEPLYLSQLSIAGVAHNVVLVVTEHDSAYAFDADTGAQLWKVSLLGSGETTSDDRGCSQVTPEIGVTSTPVIDRTAGAHGILYAVAMSKNGSNYFQRLHALDITTGAEALGGPVTVQAT